MSTAATREETNPTPAGDPFGQLEYPTSPEHPDDRHLASAAEQANAFLRKTPHKASTSKASQRRQERGL